MTIFNKKWLIYANFNEIILLKFWFSYERVSRMWLSFFKRVAYVDIILGVCRDVGVILQVCRACGRHSSSVLHISTSFFKRVAHLNVILHVCRVCGRHSSSVSRIWASFFKCVARVNVILHVCRVYGRHSSSVLRMWMSFLKCVAHVVILDVCRACERHSSRVSHVWTSFFKRVTAEKRLRTAGWNYTRIPSSVWVTVNNELRGMWKEG
jgi:hypothetical protein